MNIEYGETPQAKHIHQTPGEVHFQELANQNSKAKWLRKRFRNAERLAEFFKGARTGRSAIGNYDNCFRPPWRSGQD